jgi:small subunit ribosomal protein S20
VETLLPYLKLEVNEMPNIKSAIKRVKQSNAANEQNSNTKHAMRTAVRKAETALDAKDENATGLLRDAIKKMDTAARKGLIHKNTASRQKARLTKKAL